MATASKIMNTPTPIGVSLLDFEPTGANCYVRLLEPNLTTASGIITPLKLEADPDDPYGLWSHGDPPMVGEVIKAGASSGAVVGELVLFVSNSGVPFTADHERYTLIEAPCFLARGVR